MKGIDDLRKKKEAFMNASKEVVGKFFRKVEDKSSSPQKESSNKSPSKEDQHLNEILLQHKKKESAAYSVILIAGVMVILYLLQKIIFGPIGLILLAVGGICCMTKPDEVMFRDWFKNWYAAQILKSKGDSGTMDQIIAGISGSIVKNMGQVNISDFGIAKVAIISFSKEKIVFIGVFNTWYNIYTPL